MLSLSKKILLIIISLFFIMSCSINGKENNEKVVTNTGNVSFKLPSFSSFLEIGNKQNRDSRAILSTDDIRIKIFKDGKELKQEKSHYQKSYLGNNAYVGFDLEPGNYFLELEIYNNYNSTEEPVVTGKSDAFEIIKGESTKVEIIAKPFNPTEIKPEDTIVLNKSDFIPSKINMYTVLSGSEKWFSFKPTTDLTKLNIIENVIDNSLFMILFESNGDYTVIEYDHAFPTTPGEEYFIGVAYIEDFGDDLYYVKRDETLTSKSFTISPFTVADSDDNNDTKDFADKVEVGATTQIVLNKLNDQDFYTVDLEANVEYEFSFDLESSIPKALYKNNGELITDFYYVSETSEYSHFFNTHRYTPTENETVIISLNLDYKVIGSKDPSFIVQKCVDIPLKSIHYSDWDGFSKDAKEVEIRIIDNTTNEYEKVILPIEKDSEHGTYNLPEPLNKKGKSVLCLLKNSTGEYIGASYLQNISNITWESCSLNINSNSLNIYDIYSNKIYSTGELVDIPINYYFDSYTDDYTNTISTLKLNAVFTELPTESNLKDEDIVVTVNEEFNIIGLSFTPDKSGNYKITLQGDYANVSDSEELEYLIVNKDEGVINVTIE